MMSNNPKISHAIFACATALASACSPKPSPRTQATNALSNHGPSVVETIEFANLVDSTRSRRVPIKVHLPIEGGAFPIVIISHGAGGHWDANFAQAYHLASHGYVVLALEHVGSNTSVLKRSFRFVKNLKAMTRDPREVLGRPRDISFAIDRAEEWNQAHNNLRNRLDTQHIGVLGHSFGAYTTLVVAGMRPALNWLKPTVMPGLGLGPNLRDKRVDCGVALSPQGPGEPFFLETSYASLQTPLLGISGSRDKQQSAKPENRRRAYELWPPGDKYLIWLADADHTAFSDSTGSGRRMLPSRSRNDVQPIVRTATLLFFNAYLKADQTAKQSLASARLKPYLPDLPDDTKILVK